MKPAATNGSVRRTPDRPSRLPAIAGGAPPAIEAVGVSKRFGGVRALRDVSIAIAPGEVHAIVGENGAGKSTLGRILAGALQPDEGRTLIAGDEVRLHRPSDAHRAGVAMIAQELAVVPDMTVIENVFLGLEVAHGGVLKLADARTRFAELVAEAGFDLPPDARCGSLSVADQQKVEILRVLAREACVVIMDEPTAALTANESERLFAIVRDLRRRGTAIVYVSHFLEEVLALSDRVTVMKDGQLVRTSAAAEETTDTLVRAMLGRELDAVFPDRTPPADDAPVVLEVRDLVRAPRLGPVSLSVRAGEIVGISGLVGSGRTELARCLYGADRADSGEIEIAGASVRARDPRHAIAAGIAMLPESRKDQGLVMDQSVLENVSMAHVGDVASPLGVIDRGDERRRVSELVGHLGVRMARLSQPVGGLSGGNQQKVLMARWLFRAPKLLIIDEPTRGVDVGAKSAIYELIDETARGGVAVLMISSDLPEVLGLSDRILVMRGGRIVGEFAPGADAEDILTASFGETT